MIRADPTGGPDLRDLSRVFTDKFNGLTESSRDKFRSHNGRSSFYKNCIRAEELCMSDSSESSFDLDLFKQMLGVR